MTVRLSQFTALIFLSAAFYTPLPAQNATPAAVTTVAGNGLDNLSGENGNPLTIGLSGPALLSLAPNGDLLIAEQGAHRIRRLTRGANPFESTVAGVGDYFPLTPPFGDGGSPLDATLMYPESVIADSEGNVYIADSDHRCIRKVTSGNKPTISTLAGFCDFNSGGSYGDGGDPQRARMMYPFGLAFDKKGDLYFSDFLVGRIRKITFGPNPTIAAVAGSDAGTPLGDSSNPANASLSFPEGIAFDSAGNLYICDSGNNRIQKITFGQNPKITTVVGNGSFGFSGDGGDPLMAQIGYPGAIAFDASDQMFFADAASDRVRKVTFGPNPIITTVVGNGSPNFAGEGSDPLSTGISPTGLAIDQDGNMYVSDWLTHVRLVTGVAAKKASYAKNVSLSMTSTHLTYPGCTNLVIAISGTPTPTGTVDVYDASTKITTLYLQGDGKAYWYMQPGLSAGQHAISARYNGDSKNAAGQSAPVTVNVDPVPVNLGVGCWSASAYTYQCTVNVSSNAGSAPGSIIYSLDSNPSVSVPLSWGNGQFALQSPGVGNHLLSLQYPQQGNFAASQVKAQNFTSKK